MEPIEALKSVLCEPNGECCIHGSDEDRRIVDEALAALAPQQVPEPLTARELELIDGMIGVQLEHAMRCDQIANRRMAEKQKGWDMERVALLQKIRAAAPQPAPQPAKWVGLTRDDRECVFFEADSAMETDINLAWRNAILDAAEAKLREKNGGTA